MLDIGLHLSDFISVGPGHTIDYNEDESIICIEDELEVGSWDDLLAGLEKLTEVVVMGL